MILSRNFSIQSALLTLLIVSPNQSQKENGCGTNPSAPACLKLDEINASIDVCLKKFLQFFITQLGTDQGKYNQAFYEVNCKQGINKYLPPIILLSMIVLTLMILTYLTRMTCRWYLKK